MTEKIDMWKPTCERFVAFLDIMGFKDRLQREGNDKVKEDLMSLRPTLENIKKQAEEAKKQKKNVRTPFIKLPIELTPQGFSLFPPINFSDSIILISKDDTTNSASDIFLQTFFILCVAIINEIPIKGCIAFGKMTVDSDHSIYFGQALVDAVELQKELQLYGVVLHHTCEKQLKALSILKKFENDYVFKYEVPLKSGNINHYLLDLPDYDETAELYNEDKGTVSALYNSVSGKPRIYVDNTLKYLNWLRKEKEKKKQSKKS